MSESRNAYGSIIPNELDNENVDSDDWNVQLPFYAFATTQQVLLRASSSAKVAFLYDLFKVINNHHLMQSVLKSLDNYLPGKLRNYLRTLDYSEHVNDAHLEDHDRTLNSKELETVFKDTLTWFSLLEDVGVQVTFFLSLTSICGNTVINNLIRHINKCHFCLFKNRTPAFKYSIALPVHAANVDDVVSYVKIDDPDALLINKRRKEWDDALAKYRNKVERSTRKEFTSPPVNVISEDDVKTAGRGKNKQTSKRNNKKSQPANDRSQVKTKSDKDVKAKNGRDNKGRKKAESSIDYIQLMPIWISITIFKYLDAKTLKIIKSVNAHWEFVVSCTIREEKARKKMNSWIESIESEFNLKTFVRKIPLAIQASRRRFNRRTRSVACSLRIHDELKAQTTTTAPQENCSVLSEAPNCKDAIPGNNSYLGIRPMERMVPLDSTDDGTKYLHQRTPCIQYDNETIERVHLSEISLANYSREEPDNVSPTNSEFLDSLLKMLTPSHSIENKEKDRELYDVVANSFVNALRVSRTGGAAISELLNLKSFQLAMLLASLDHGMKSTRAISGNSEHVEDSDSLSSTYKDYLVQEDMS